jgi:hypothetical protein
MKPLPRFPIRRGYARNPRAGVKLIRRALLPQCPLYVDATLLSKRPCRPLREKRRADARRRRIPGNAETQRMVMTCPKVEDCGVKSSARITGTNLSVRMRISEDVPSGSSSYSVFTSFSLCVSPLTTKLRPPAA